MTDITKRLLSSKIAIFLSLVSIVFIAHFLYSKGFGFYEGDSIYFSNNLGQKHRTILQIAINYFKQLGRAELGLEGRPILFFLMHFFSLVGAKIAGLWGIYLVASLFLSINAFLFYILFSRIVSPLFGFIGALIFALFPAHTMHPFLNSAIGCQSSATFLLLASTTYVKRVKVLPYILITMSLLTYESFFFLFFAAPLLLDQRWNKQLLKKLIINGTVLVGILTVVFYLRSSTGEGNVAGISSNLSEIPLQTLETIFFGTLTSTFYSFYNAVIYTSQNLDIGIVLTIIFFSATLFFIFFQALQAKNGVDCETSEDGSPNRHMSLNNDDDNTKYLRTLLIGLIFVILSYTLGFYFYGSARAVIGIASRVHFAAVFGTAIVIPSLYFLIINNLKTINYKRSMVAVFAILISFLIGYGQLIQYDYKAGWVYQQWLWTSIIEQSPDIDDGTLILVDRSNLPGSKFIGSHSWFAQPSVLSKLFQFPSKWKQQPRMSYMKSDWTKTDVRNNNGKLEIFLRRPHYINSTKPEWVSIPKGKIIVFKRFRNKLLRIDGTIAINGGTLHLKPKPNTDNPSPKWPKRILYDYLFNPTTTTLNLFLHMPSLRELLNLPPISSLVSFSGTNLITLSDFNHSDIKKFTIEMWLKPGENNIPFDRFEKYSKTYPPMPGLIGPLRLDQYNMNSLLITLKDINDETNIYEILEILDEYARPRWLHLLITVDNEKRKAAIFVNGEKKKEFSDIEIPLRGRFVLGKGYRKRFWRGDIADIRISNTVRHAEDFEPGKTAITNDSNTLFLSDASLLKKP